MTEQKQRMMLEEGLCKVTVKRKGEQGLKSVGIGINIGKQPLPLDLYKITALSPQGSAAETGRIKVGDIIHKVDGLPVKTLELAEMVEKIKGPVGTSVERRELQKGAAASDQPRERAASFGAGTAG